MRHIVLADNNISDAEFEQWRIEDAGFWKQHIGITPTYIIERADYSSYPTFIDEDGDIRPTNAYLKSLNDQMVAKYGEFGFDFLMVMIHQDNWKSAPPGGRRIYGTNYSYAFGKQTLQYCRWDKKNLATTFGTTYHERMHSLDAICQVEVGVDIRPLLSVRNFDADVVHGADPRFSYIRHKENVEVLKPIAPHLRAAFSKRAERHQNFLNMKKQIALLEKVVYWYKILINRKNGVPRQ